MYLDLSAPPVFMTHSHCRLRAFAKGEQHQNRTPVFSTLILVIKGRMSFKENGEERHISAGNYYIQRAGTRQEGLEITEPPIYYYLHFSGVFKENPSVSSVPISGSFDLETVSELCTSIIFNSKSLTEEVWNFYNILLHLKKRNAQKGHSFAADMSDYISRHIAKIESVDDLCKRFNYSKDHIIRVFRENFGKTPYKYITDRKIKLAKELLKNTNLSVAQISQNCGYRDLSVFYRAFKSRTGKSPIDYKRDKNNEN